MSARLRDPPLALSEEIEAARAAGRAVVALESTIIAHGMPFPDNLATGRALEAAVRDEGAIPATIAVLDGAIRIGLSDAELQRIASDPELPKLSRRDLPAVLARRGSGATTVAATMIAAHMAGIRIFATGGIGGVHRGAETSFDVSADLEELARTPVAVVCAGAKSILDLPKTMEVLESKGVPVVGFGTDELPAFYCWESGIAVPLRVDTAAEAAALIAMQVRLGYPGGVVIGVPIPQADALPSDAIDAAIEAALAKAERSRIVGKAVTPFLMKRIVAATGGRALKANIALAVNNARVAARIARRAGRAPSLIETPLA